MNFLEQLTAEWYEYNGYLCRTNIRFGKRKSGGHVGEMDVIAYNPKTKDFLHIECSTDSWSWEKKKETFLKKFDNASKYYDEYFEFDKNKVQKIAITGFYYARDRQKMDFGNNIQVKLVPDFLHEISARLSIIDPWTFSVNENSYPLLRAIQYGTFYLSRKVKEK